MANVKNKTKFLILLICLFFSVFVLFNQKASAQDDFDTIYENELLTDNKSSVVMT